MVFMCLLILAAIAASCLGNLTGQRILFPISGMIAGMAASGIMPSDGTAIGLFATLGTVIFSCLVVLVAGSYIAGFIRGFRS